MKDKSAKNEYRKMILSALCETVVVFLVIATICLVTKTPILPRIPVVVVTTLGFIGGYILVDKMMKKHKK